MIGNNLLMAGDEGYNLTRSLRFRASASAYLSRTPAVSGNQRTWTWNGAFKRGDLGRLQLIFSAYGAPDADDDSFGFDASDRFFVYAATIHANLRLSTQVFKDPAAFYWVDVAMDTTNATAQNRLRVWVNGTEITTWTTNYSIPLNQLYYFNQNVPAKIGATHVPTLLLDGYLAEVNFIDGQALTPSSFGSYNSTTGVWQPAAYTGTYGTNGFYLPFSIVGGSTYAASFNGSSQSLSGTLASAIGSGNFTVELWVNPTSLSNYNDWFGVTRGAGGFNVGTDAAGTLVFYSGGTRQLNVAGVISASRYTHVAFVRNGTTLTGYVNGVSAGTATVSTNFTATGFFIGSLDNSTEFNNGLISNLRVTNTAVYTTNFTPPSTALAAISGTMLLTLQSATIVDNSGNSISIGNSGSVATSTAYPFVVALGSDFSGNNNNWTTNNISITSGVTYDSMTDVPTLTSATAANFCVLSPIDNSSNGVQVVLSNANLDLSLGSGQGRATFSVSSGKWYWEITSGATNQGMYGIIKQSVPIASATFSSADGYYYWASSGAKYNNGAGVAYGSGLASGDILGVAFDASAGTLTYYKNNVSLGVAFSGLSGTFSPAFCQGNTTAYATFNFGQRPFTHTPPTGFVALNSFNIPAGSITTSGSFTGNVSADGPSVYLNGVPTAMTINGNAVTLGTHADKTAYGFKVRSSSTSYNSTGTNTYSITTTGAKFKYANAQGNP